MPKSILNPATLAPPSGYSHGIVSRGGRLLFIAGQTALNALGRITHPGDIVGQFRQALANVREVIVAAGGEMTDIVQMTVFVTDKAAYQAHLKSIGAVYQSFLGRYYPAMALVEVKSLWDDEALVEIVSVAVIGD